LKRQTKKKKKSVTKEMERIYKDEKWEENGVKRVRRSGVILYCSVTLPFDDDTQ
jgi:protein associated with RNAse G/E